MMRFPWIRTRPCGALIYSQRPTKQRKIEALGLLPYELRHLYPVPINMHNTQKHRTKTGKVQSRSPKMGSDENPMSPSFVELVKADPLGGWDKCWELGLTPWDTRSPTPIVAHLHRTRALPYGRALIPGCGTGYDVVEMACPERYVVGLDLSETAIKKASELFSSLPNSKHFTFLKEDFFSWHPSEPFDLIFDYLFFCAIEPCKRWAWGKRMHELLKEDGELITLIFPIDDRASGPPYKVSTSDYEEVLSPLGFRAVSIVDNEFAIKPRKGLEKLGRWKKSSRLSSL